MSTTEVNLHIYPAPIEGESRIFRQTSAISEAGLFDEIVICGTSRPDLPRVQELGAFRKIERVSSGKKGRASSAYQRIWEQLHWSVRVFRRWKRSQVRMVNAHSVAVLPVSYAIARVSGARLIYDTHELETETSTSRGLQRIVFKAIERLFIHRCDAVITVNESISTWYENKYPGISTVAVRNAPQPRNRIAKKSQSPDLRDVFKIEDDELLFVHVGNIVQHRYIPEVLEAFAHGTRTNMHVGFLGSGPLDELVREYATKYPNIHYHEPVEAEEVVPAITSADVGICLIEATCLSYSLSLPNKAMEYLMAGIPFLYSELTEVDRLLDNGLAEWRVDPSAGALPPILLGIDQQMLSTARGLISTISLPNWQSEADRMIREYRRVLGRIKK